MTRIAALHPAQESRSAPSLRLRLPVWRLTTWGAVCACLAGLPILFASLYRWWIDPEALPQILLAACAVLAAAGCAGVYVLVRVLGAELHRVAIANAPAARRRFPIREIGEVIAANEAATETLRAVHASVLQAEEAERRRLARELHDELGQELALLHMWLQTRRNDGIDAETRGQRLRDCESLAGTIMERVRSMALDLRPAQLDDLGLPAALRTLARRVGRQTGITVTLLAVPPSAQRFAEPIETALFRIAQAAVTNAVRHAGASTLWIALEVEGGRATVKVQDDGSGFDLDEVAAKARSGAGMGLRVMQERVQALGGAIEIITAPGTGTLVKASFPVAAADAA
jgi:signal transduction histidine kinase